ncbi:MAG: transcriptional repressor [Oscillospiraceae bacterium]|jgi:Fur family ferric uptake transcriptional regulator|nr:transcriptional repressor [Oscillospiraceae bacterium]
MAYQTKQGQALLDFLRDQGSRHISVQEIAHGLPEPMGTATIYRQLEKLVAKGLVQKYVNDRGPACFQYVGEKGENCATHFHLKCARCGALIHLECQEMTRLIEHITKEHGFRTDLTRSAFYGTCAECQKKEETK